MYPRKTCNHFFNPLCVEVAVEFGHSRTRLVPLQELNLRVTIKKVMSHMNLNYIYRFIN
jgi:hypothetical protein